MPLESFDQEREGLSHPYMTRMDISLSLAIQCLPHSFDHIHSTLVHLRISHMRKSMGQHSLPLTHIHIVCLSISIRRIQSKSHYFLNWNDLSQSINMSCFLGKLEFTQVVHDVMLAWYYELTFLCFQSQKLRLNWILMEPSSDPSPHIFSIFWSQHHISLFDLTHRFESILCHHESIRRETCCHLFDHCSILLPSSAESSREISAGRSGADVEGAGEG